MKYTFLFIFSLLLLVGCNGAQNEEKNRTRQAYTSIQRPSIQRPSTQRPSTQHSFYRLPFFTTTPIFSFPIQASACSFTKQKEWIYEMVQKYYLFYDENDDQHVLDIFDDSVTPIKFFNSLKKDKFSDFLTISGPLPSDDQNNHPELQHRHLGSKIDYVFFPSFEGELFYQLVDVFKILKKNNTEEVILDLRGNLGGDVDIISPIAALIGGERIAGKPFVILRGKKGKISKNSESSLYYKAPIDAQLNLTRVFILTDNHTSSASETLIHGLKVYIKVIQIGQKTKGKFFAGSIYTSNNNKNCPVNYLYLMNNHVFNALKEEGPSDGLKPDYEVDLVNQDPPSGVMVPQFMTDAMAALPTPDPMVALAIQLIYNSAPG